MLQVFYCEFKCASTNTRCLYPIVLFHRLVCYAEYCFILTSVFLFTLMFYIARSSQFIITYISRTLVISSDSIKACNIDISYICHCVRRFVIVIADTVIKIRGDDLLWTAKNECHFSQYTKSHYHV